MSGLRTVWNWWWQPATLAISFYRFAHASHTSSSRPHRLGGEILYRLLYPLVEAWSGVSLPRETEVGRNLRIHHRGKVVINGESVIGDNCSIVHGVTLGNRFPGGPCPVIGNNVELGAYAQIVGGVHVGDGAKIGALTVVVADVPMGATVVGPKARILATGPED